MSLLKLHLESRSVPHTYRPEIDGLRAFAVLSVVIYHSFPSLLPGGFTGVDVFFVISGFLITRQLMRDLTSNEFNLFLFWGRRIRRLFPSLIAVLTTSLVIGWLMLLADEYSQLGMHIASGATFIINFVLANELGYFNNASETKPMLHLWSLAIEEQFYILWPIVLWFAWWLRLNFFAVTVALFCLSFWCILGLIEQDKEEAFYWPFGRFWEILAGAMLAWLYLNKKQIIEIVKWWANSLLPPANVFLHRSNSKIPYTNSSFANCLSAIGFLLFAYGIYFLDDSLDFPSVWTIIPIISATFIISAGRSSFLNRILLMNPVALWFGLISYPLYLWHWPILTFLRINEGQDPSVTNKFIAISLSIFLAWITFRYLERPIQKKSLSAQKAVILFLCLAIPSLSGFYIYKQNGVPERNFIVQNEDVHNEFVGALWKYSKNDMCKQNYWVPGAERWGWFFCMMNSTEVPTVIILGSSYANHLYPGFVNSTRLSHHSVLSIGTCGVAWVDYESKLREQRELKNKYSPCFGERAILQLEHINEIIETESRLKYAILSLDTIASENTSEFERLLQRIQFIASAGLDVILFQPHINPRAEYDIKSCFRRIGKQYNDCLVDKEKLAIQREKFQTLVKALKSRGTSFYHFDPNIMFCNDEGKCSYKLNGHMPAFRDRHAHFSLFASNLLFDKYFVKWAETELPAILNRDFH